MADVLSISLRFKHAYCVPCFAARTSCGWSFTKSHGPQYAGVRKLRALCVSVIIICRTVSVKIDGNTHVRSEVKSTVTAMCIKSWEHLTQRRFWCDWSGEGHRLCHSPDQSHQNLRCRLALDTIEGRWDAPQVNTVPAKLA